MYFNIIISFTGLFLGLRFFLKIENDFYQLW